MEKQESYHNRFKMERYEHRRNSYGSAYAAIKDELEKQCEHSASLMRELESKDIKIFEMYRRYDEMVTNFQQEVNELTETINNKNCKLTETETKKDADAEFKRLQSVNRVLEKKLKAIENNNLESQITNLRKELKEKSETLQNLQSQSRKELQEARNEFITLKTESEENSEYLESLNNALMLKESMSRKELQEARSESITSLEDLLNDRAATLVIKRMGELDLKVFQEACLRKFPNGNWVERYKELCWLWEEYLKDGNWHPFKKVEMKGVLEEIVDEDDEKLKELRDEYGETVYKAVANALMEMNEHNPSGRYLVSEVWNPREGRIATMKEIVQFLVKQVKNRKRKR